MRALERVLQTPDWVTAILFLSLLLLVVLKAYNPQKLSGVLSSLYNKGFLEIEAQEKQSPFTFFTIVFTLFSLFSIALGVYVSICYVTKQQFLFTDYTQILLFLLIYMFGRFTLEYLLTQLFGIKNELSFFFQSKRSYLFSISAGIWVFVLIYFYSNSSIYIFWVGCILLFTARLIAILFSNKNLIFSKLFYFILYLCAFEIAPLLILYKMITK